MRVTRACPLSLEGGGGAFFMLGGQAATKDKAARATALNGGFMQIFGRKREKCGKRRGAKNMVVVKGIVRRD